MCNKREKCNFISSSFLSLWRIRKWYVRVKRECFEIKEHIYTRNLERWKRGNIEIERESEEKKKEKSEVLGKSWLANFQKMLCN
jgi:hypothetical protein